VVREFLTNYVITPSINIESTPVGPLEYHWPPTGCDLEDFLFGEVFTVSRATFAER
jgi:hypothetical protein